MAELTRSAPAKLNLTLEVLGKWADGYHELSSVVTTIDLCDYVTVSAGQGFVVSADEDYDTASLPDGREALNTVETALALAAIERTRQASAGAELNVTPALTFSALEEALRFGVAKVAISLQKRIPAAAGLGGGSSDGAAALVALNDYWGLRVEREQLEQLALAVGSDCPFFVRGGVQLMRGRGEILQPLPAPARAWFCLLLPPRRLDHKTARLYGLLGRAQYSSGERSAALAQRLRAEPSALIRADNLCNTFDAVADEAFGNLDSYRRALYEHDALAVHLCGSGPALYALCASEEHALAMERSLRQDGFDARCVSTPPCL